MEMPNPKEKVQVEKTISFFRRSWKFIVKHKVGDILAWTSIIGINVFYITSIMSVDSAISNEDSNENTSEITEPITGGDCNVLQVDIAGYITSDGINGSTDWLGSDGDTVYSDDIKYQIDYAKRDEDTKAVLLTINSFGGNAGSAQEIVYALENLDKPVVAVIRTAGNSAAYWIASVAKKIYAYKTADVGSIGVTQSYLDETAKNIKDGKEFISLSSGKFKDMGNPDKPMTAEEKALVMRDIKDVYNIFVEQVADFRGMPIEKAKALADGSSMIAGRAKEQGLIDEIGSTYDAIDYLTEVIGEKAEVCELDDE